MAALAQLFGSPDAQVEQDDDKLLHLYWNRAELKKEYSRLRKERFELLDQLKVQEGRNARLQQKLDGLEELLADRTAANRAVVFYQIRGVWKRCHARLEKFAGQMATQVTERERKRLLGAWAAEQTALRREAAGRLDRARARRRELEAALGDIDFDAGRFTVTGTDRSVALSDLAAEAADAGRPLSAKDTHTVDGPGLPHGAHGCEVEITPETGHIRLVRVVTVIDPGTVINPTLLEGQMHGGVVQGLGEALHERVVFDGETGQLLSGSFMDFTLPRADDVPMIETVLDADASPASPLGVKGVGEIGTMVVQAVVVNAVLDALKDYGISHLDMPVTAESVWLAIRQAQSV